MPPPLDQPKDLSDHLKDLSDLSENLSDLSPPSPRFIESSATIRIKLYNQLGTDAEAELALKKLTAAASTAASTAATSHSAGDKTRARLWRVLENTVRTANEDLLSIQKDVEIWQESSLLYQRFMWEYYRTLEEVKLKMHKMENMWVEASLDHHRATFAEPGDVSKTLEDFKRLKVIDWYPQSVQFFRDENSKLEKENNKLRSKELIARPKVTDPKLNLVTAELGPVRPTTPPDPVRPTTPPGLVRPATPPDPVRPATPPNPVSPTREPSPVAYDSHAFDHVVELYRQTSDLMLELFTGHAVDWDRADREDWKEAWINFNKHFQIIRRLSELPPPSSSNDKKTPDLTLGEPDHLQHPTTDAEWQEQQTKIDEQLKDLGREKLLELLVECKQTSVKLREKVMGKRRWSWWPFSWWDNYERKKV